MKKFWMIIVAMALLIPNLSHANDEVLAKEARIQMAQCEQTALKRHPGIGQMEILRRCYTVFFLKTVYSKGTVNGHLNAIYGRDTELADMEYLWNQTDLLWEKVIE